MDRGIYLVRKGRDLEEVIKKLEEATSMGLIVKSPDFILDKITNSKREVDVSIRGRIGSHDFLIIIECRKRRVKGTVDWIEQIITKTKDLGADKVIAISSSGFSENAIEKARMHNVVTRTLEQVSVNEIPGWLNIEISEFSVLRSEYRQISIVFNDENNQPSKLDLDLKEKSPIFIQKKDGKHLFFSDIWQCLPIEKFLSKDLEKPFHIVMGVPRGEKGLEIIIRDKKKEVLTILVIADLWIETIPVTKKNILQYKQKDDLIAQIHQFDLGFGYHLEAIETKDQ